MFQELLERLQKPMTVEQKSTLMDEIVVALLKDRAEVEALNKLMKLAL